MAIQKEIKENRRMGGAKHFIILYDIGNSTAYSMKEGLLNFSKASQKNVHNDSH